MGTKPVHERPLLCVRRHGLTSQHVLSGLFSPDVQASPAVQESSISGAGWPFGERPAVFVETDPFDNHVSTRDTIALMSLAVLSGDGAGAVIIKEVAAALLSASYSLQEAVKAAYHWCRSHVLVVPDEDLLDRHFGSSAGRDLIIPPSILLGMRVPRGDCDDMSTLLASLLVAMGVPCSFKTIKANPSEPDKFSHVYVVAHLPEGNMPLDASHGEYPGWETQEHFGGEKIWPVITQ